jgi:hypothetical protein
MAIEFAAQTGLWAQMEKNGDGPQKVAELCGQIYVEEELLQRMMRHIAASGYLEAVAPDEYKVTNFGKAMLLDAIASGYQVW